MATEEKENTEKREDLEAARGGREGQSGAKHGGRRHTHTQATSDPGEEGTDEEKKGTQRLRWADCDDEEEKENQEEQETEGDKEKDGEREEEVKGEKEKREEETTGGEMTGLRNDASEMEDEKKFGHVENEPEMDEEGKNRQVFEVVEHKVERKGKAGRVGTMETRTGRAKEVRGGGSSAKRVGEASDRRKAPSTRRRKSVNWKSHVEKSRGEPRRREKNRGERRRCWKNR